MVIGTGQDSSVRLTKADPNRRIAALLGGVAGDQHPTPVDQLHFDGPVAAAFPQRLELDFARSLFGADRPAVDGLELGVEPRQQLVDRGAGEVFRRLAIDSGVGRVAGHQVLGPVEHGKAVRQAFDGILEELQPAFDVLLRALAVRDVEVDRQDVLDLAVVVEQRHLGGPGDELCTVGGMARAFIEGQSLPALDHLPVTLLGPARGFVPEKLSVGVADGLVPGDRPSIEKLLIDH
jgi:hypothetical protein